MIEQLKNSAQAHMNSQIGGNAGGPAQGLGGLFSNPGGLAAAGAAGGLAGLFLGGGKPKKLAKNAVKFGGVALVGGLAYKAWRDWQSKNPNSGAVATAPTAAQPVSEAVFIPESADQQTRLAKVLARAMIAATKADGTVTDTERTRIINQLTHLGVAQNDIAFVNAEINKPLDMQEVVRDASSPELAVEIYTASLLAIDPNGRAERGYLTMLASQLALDPSLVDQVHANLAAEKDKAVA